MDIDLKTPDFWKLQQELHRVQEKFIMKTLTNEDIEYMLKTFEAEKQKYYKVKDLLIRLANKL